MNKIIAYTLLWVFYVYLIGVIMTSILSTLVHNLISLTRCTTKWTMMSKKCWIRCFDVSKSVWKAWRLCCYVCVCCLVVFNMLIHSLKWSKLIWIFISFERNIFLKARKFLFSCFSNQPSEKDTTQGIEAKATFQPIELSNNPLFDT